MRKFLCLEARKPLLIALPTEEILFVPGSPIPIEEKVALKILAMAKKKFRVVEASNFPLLPEHFQEGWSIEWNRRKNQKGRGKVELIDHSESDNWVLISHNRNFTWLHQTLIAKYIPSREERR